MPSPSHTPHVCPFCLQDVDPTAPGVVLAAQVSYVVTVRSSRQVIDGDVALFHAECPPGAVGYAIRRLPFAA